MHTACLPILTRSHRHGNLPALSSHIAYLLCSKQYIEDHRGERIGQDDIIIIHLGHSIGDQHIVCKDNLLLDVSVDLFHQLLLCIYLMSSWIYLAHLSQAAPLSWHRYMCIHYDQ